MARILIIAGDGTSTGHVDYALCRMWEEGFEVTVASPARKPFTTVIHQREEGHFMYALERAGYIIEADAALDEIDPSKFDALLLPGGRAPEYLRNNESCVDIARHFLESNKPIGAICHGPHILLAAGLTGRRMTSIDTIRLDVTAAGNTYIDSRDRGVVDGNLVSAHGGGAPDYSGWIRPFLSLLSERGFQTSVKKGAERPDASSTRILIIAGDFTSTGQLQYAMYRMREEGYKVTVAAPVKRRMITVMDMREEGWAYDQERLGYWIEPDAAFDDLEPAAFDALILPGWRATEHLRNNNRCIELVRHFLESNKPVASICQAPRLLVAAGARGRRLTGIDMIKPDIVRAGNTYVEAGGEAVIDGNIVSVSRRPYHHVWMRAFQSLLRDGGIVA